MSIPGGTKQIALVAGLLALLAGGCVSHDQVYLKNPSPCRVRCHPDYVAPLNPECHGYHSTCWAPWSCNCNACPPPLEGVGVTSPDHFELLPEEVPMPAGSTVPSSEPPVPELPPGMSDGSKPRSRMKLQPVSKTSATAEIEDPNGPPALPDYFQ
jgi:hypothetical protein